MQASVEEELKLETSAIEEAANDIYKLWTEIDVPTTDK